LLKVLLELGGDQRRQRALAEALDQSADATQGGVEDVGQVRGSFGGPLGVIAAGAGQGEGQVNRVRHGGVLSFGELLSPLVEGKAPPFYKPAAAGVGARPASSDTRKPRHSRTLEGPHPIRFYVTPTQASWLNRIESQFTALKEFALNNSDFRSHEEQIEAILRYLDWRNRKRGISLADWQEYKRQQARPA
jgi:hypothetical protein